MHLQTCLKELPLKFKLTILLKIIATIGNISFITANLYCQYNTQFVETRTQVIQGEQYSIIKMSREDEHVKVKYFAAKDYLGNSVYKRYLDWSKDKNIILYTSGTYMNDYDINLALPEGICVDNGNIVNKVLQAYDGLAIVYQTGGIAVSNIKKGDLTISFDGVKKKIDLRNALDRIEFFKWAQGQNATVFQTHLFYFMNSLLINRNTSSNKKQERRFFAVGKLNGRTTYYIINLASPNTIYDATVKVANFLTNFEELEEITFILNLDTGAQNVFQLKTSEGKIDNRKSFQGTLPINNALNLLVYYYE